MKRVALFVGVDEYEDGSIADLEHAVDDSESLAAAFETLLGFDRVEKLRNPAGKKDILGKVSEVTDGLKKGDLFFFFFAGHGFRVKENHVLVCKKDLYADLEDEYDGLPMGQLKKRMRGPWDRMLVIDACQNDIRKTRGADEGMAARDLELILNDGEGEKGIVGEGVQVVVTSCSEGQKALEVGELRHGLFTTALLETVKEHARMRTRLDMAGFREEMMARMGTLAKMYRLGRKQNPMFKIPGECGVVLLEGDIRVVAQGGGEAKRILEDEERRGAEEDGGKGEEAEEGGRTMRRVDLGYGVALEMVACPEIAMGFWMGRMPVTQEQWLRVMGTNPSRAKDRTTHPVTHVSWNACQRFVERLNGMAAARESGLEFRLPREDEWQAACRAGAPKTEKFCLLVDGTQITESTLGRVAWFGERGRKATTHPVGEKEPNAWGLYDMFGNVDEWVLAESMGNWKKQAICGGNAMGRACGADWRARIGAETANGTIGLRLAAFEREGEAAEVERVRKGAWDGKAEAELELGLRFEEGRGVERDGKEALKWVVRAAEEGLAAAQVAYGERWRQGRGVEANATKAAAWYRKAAAQKDAEGQYRLGMCYLQGEGVQQNDAQAGNWLKKAAGQGHEAAAEAFRGMAGRLEALKREKEEKRKREAEEQKAREAERRKEEEEKRAKEAEARKQALEARRAEVDEWQHELARAQVERTEVFERFRRCLAEGDEKAAMATLNEVRALRQRAIWVQQNLAAWIDECFEEGDRAGAEAAERECQAWKEVELQLVRDVNDLASDFEEGSRKAKQGHLDTKVRMGGRVVQVHVTGAEAAPAARGGKEEKQGWLARLFGRGRVAECPICGGKNEPKETFRCPKCGRNGLCPGHRDRRTGWCEECARKAAAQSGGGGIESAAMSEKRKWLNAYLERMQETMGILGLPSVIVDHITAWDRKAQFWEMGGCRGPEPELTDIMKTCLKEGRKIVEGLG